MRKSLVILLFALCLSTLSFKVYAVPEYSNATNTTPATYDSNTFSQFNVTWSNDVNMTFITITNSTTVLINNASISNSTYGGDIYNYSIVLSAGTWNWTSYANDSSGNWNNTDNITFTISKGNITPLLNIYVDGVFNNKTVLLSTSNISASSAASGDSGVVYTLWSNNSQLVNGSSVWNATPTQRGTYVYVFNTTGGENWSSGTTSGLYIYDTDLNFSGNSTIPVSGTQYGPSSTYNFSINLNGSISNILFEANFLNSTFYNYTNSSATYNITNSSGTYWITFPALAANPSGYNYMWVANDTNNFWVNTSNSTFVIAPALISPGMSCSNCLNTAPPWTAKISTTVTLTCSHTINASLSILGGLSSWSCSSTIGNPTSCSFTTSSTSNNATYICSASGNYTGSTPGALSWAELVNNNQGSSSSSSQSSSGSFSITPSSSSVTINPGSSSVITLTLLNALSSGDVINISISVSGINSSWYSLDKTSIARIGYGGGNTTAKLTINIPNDTASNIYTITVTVAGKDFSLAPISRSATITLNVQQPSVITPGATEVQETTNETNETNQTNETEASASVTETSSDLLGFFTNSSNFGSIVLFLGLVAAGIVFIFRSNITELLGGGAKPPVHHEQHAPHEHQPQKKPSFLSSFRSRLPSMGDRKLVIHLKKKEKEKD